MSHRSWKTAYSFSVDGHCIALLRKGQCNARIIDGTDGKQVADHDLDAFVKRRRDLQSARSRRSLLLRICYSDCCLCLPTVSL